MSDAEIAIQRNDTLYNLLKMYCSQYKDIRRQNDDLSNLSFHQKHGLCLSVPQEWPLLPAVARVISDGSFDGNFKKTSIIYSTTSCFCLIHDILNSPEDDECPDVEYMSWHEIFTAIQMNSSDVRYMKKVKDFLDSSLVIGLDPLTLPGVEDQVRGHVTGCLLILSQGGV